MGCVRNRGEMSPVFLNSGCKSDIVRVVFLVQGAEATPSVQTVVCFGFHSFASDSVENRWGPWGPKRSYGDPMGIPWVLDRAWSQTVVKPRFSNRF